MYRDYPSCASKKCASKKLFFSRREEAAIYPLGRRAYFTTNGLFEKVT